MINKYIVRFKFNLLKKITIIFLLIFFAYSNVFAQNTIGDSKDEIRKIVQTNPNFKLLPGNNCDTLIVPQVMQAIIFYKNNICYSSISVFPLAYETTIIDKMRSESYKKVNENTWINSEETIQVTITNDKIKGVCLVTATAFDKTKN